jgi:hypothetical protein
MAVQSRLAAVLAALVVTAGSVAACDLDARPSSGAPPTVVCGQTIAGGAAGSGVTDATRQGAITVTGLTVAGVVLQVSNSCSTGATVHITPANAMRVGAEARAKDGKLAAMVLVPQAKTADVAITRADGTSTTVRIRLTG